MSVPVIARVHYYAPSSDRRNFYSSGSSNDYISYIDKGIDSRRGADRDYMEYMGNPDKSTGVFSDKGILSFEEKKELRNMLRNAKGNIWDLVISLDGDLGKERLYSYEQAYQMVRNVLPKLFDNMGFLRKDIVWYAGLHTNTDNRHVHISFFEKEPTFYSTSKKEYTYRKGRISNQFIRQLKGDVEEYLFSDREEEKLRRKRLMEEIMSSTLSFDDKEFAPFLRSEVRVLMEMIPLKGKHSYMSLNDNVREHVDRISNVLLSNTKSGGEMLTMLKDMKMREKECEKRYGAQKGRRKSDVIEADIYRRIGNQVIDRVIRERDEALVECNSIRDSEMRRKNEMKKIGFLICRIKELDEEERRETEAFIARVKKEIEKEKLKEEGLPDEAELG